MSQARFKSGFSIIELIAVIAIALVLGGIVLGVGNQVRSQANVQLAQSTIDVLVCALEQYYAVCNDFPDAVENKDQFSTSIDGLVTVIPDSPDMNSRDWSSGALYYFLQKIPNSKNIIKALNESAQTTRDANNTVVQLDLWGDGTEVIYFTRFIDPWGRSLKYTYLNGQCFPKIVSAGEDGAFGNGDDVCSRP